jgi:RHS repeat-associated protein
MGYHLTAADDVEARLFQSSTTSAKYTLCIKKPTRGPIFIWVLSTKYTEDETGLVYYGYRYYQPESGRWVNRDPAETLHKYGFVGNDMIGSVDARGLWTVKYMSDGKEVRSIGDVAVKEWSSASGEFIDSTGIKWVMDLSGMPDLDDPKWEQWVEAHQPCKGTIELLIYIPKKPVSIVKGKKYHYKLHTEDLSSGGLGPGFDEEILAHEKGHAEAWFSHCKPCIDAVLSQNTSSAETPITRSKRAALEADYTRCVEASAYLRASAQKANNATIAGFADTSKFTKLAPIPGGPIWSQNPDHPDTPNDSVNYIWLAK